MSWEWEKTQIEQVKNQVQTDLLFRYGNRPQRVCTSRSNGQSTLLPKGSWKTLKNGHVCETKH